MTKQSIEKAKSELSFLNEGDYITREMSECKEILEEYIEYLENKVEALSKGNHSLMQSRKKWKDRYYKLRGGEWRWR